VILQLFSFPPVFALVEEGASLPREKKGIWSQNFLYPPMVKRGGGNPVFGAHSPTAPPP